MAGSYIEMFEETYYPPAFLHLFQKTKEAIEKEQEEIQEMIGKGLNSYLELLQKLQKEEILPSISEITISFLFTSYYLKQPVFQLDCYGAGGQVLRDSFLTEYMQADWLTRYIEEFQEELLEQAKKNRLGRFIRKAEMQVLGLRAVRSLLSYFSGYMKYWIPDNIDKKKLGKLQKEENFFITFGEYKDWQKPVLARLPEVDIFNCDMDTSLLFRTFRGIYYEKKSLINLNLNFGVFKDCMFQNCEIRGCKMNDCLFENCKFEDVIIEQGENIAGSYANCHFDKVKFEKVIFSDSKKEEKLEVYKNTEFYHCHFQHTEWNECDLSDSTLSFCEIEEIQMKECKTLNSDFASFSVSQEQEKKEEE